MVSPPIPQPTWQQSWAVTQSKTLMAHFRSWEQLLKDKLGHIFTLVLVGRTIRELNQEDATHVAAAYYAILSLSLMAMLNAADGTALSCQADSRVAPASQRPGHVTIL